MSYLCPICNGLANLNVQCPECHHQLDDYGRIDQIWEPYSPYREIDDIKLTNGYDDFTTHKCVHLTTCSCCGKDQIIFINEQ